MKFLKGFFIFIVGSFVFLMLIGNLIDATDGDTRTGPEKGALNVQRILVAAENGWDRSAITAIGRSASAVKSVGGNRYHVENWYETKISSSRINYKMIVRYPSSNDTYYLVCFSTEVDYPVRNCF
jgi:hypothetical protein